MSFTAKLFRSIVAGARPTLTQIQDKIFGLNTADGKLFLYNSAGSKADSVWVRGLDYAARAYWNITGGGTLVWDANGISWSARLVVMSNGRTPDNAIGGFFEITMPANGTVITGVGGAANATVANGRIPITAFQCLYYILPLGSTGGSLSANLRIAHYTADFDIPPHWIPIAVHNNDGGTIKFSTGHILDLGETLDTTTSYGVNKADKTAPTILNSIAVTSAAGDAILQLETQAPANTIYRRKMILSSPNVGSGNDWLFRSVRPSDGATVDVYLRSTAPGDIWTSGNFTPSNYAALNSAPTFTGNVSTKGATGGYTSIVNATGEATRTGYLAFYQQDGTRAAYMGYASTSTKILEVRAENGYQWSVFGNFTMQNDVGVVGTLGFGARLGQFLNMYSTAYGFGIQDNTLYARTGGYFTVHVGGSHVSTQGNPGTGGTNVFTVSTNGTSLTSPVFIPDAGTGAGLRIGDDATMGDVNIAHTLGVRSTSAPNVGFIAYGNGNKRIGYDGATFQIEGEAHVQGINLTIGSNQPYTFLRMGDNDEGMRFVHCNSSAIGFLGSDGNWKFQSFNDGNMWTPMFGYLSSFLAGKWDNSMVGYVGGNGYLRLPNGFLIQWGEAPGGAAQTTINWPTAFASVWSVTATTVQASTAAWYFTQILSWSATQLTLFRWANGGANAGSGSRYIAIGN